MKRGDLLRFIGLAPVALLGAGTAAVAGPSCSWPTSVTTGVATLGRMTGRAVTPYPLTIELSPFVNMTEEVVVPRLITRDAILEGGVDEIPLPVIWSQMVPDVADIRSALGRGD